MSNTNEQQIVDAVEVVDKVVVEVPTKGKGKSTKKQTAGASTSDETVSALKLLVEELSKRVEELETRVSQLEGKTEVETPVKSKTKAEKSTEEKKPRAPTAYNLFMKEKMTELKDTHPTLTNIERMKMAAEAWSESKK